MRETTIRFNRIRTGLFIKLHDFTRGVGAASYDIAQMLPARSIKAGNYQLSEGPRDPPAKQTIVLDIDNVVALANQIF